MSVTVQQIRLQAYAFVREDAGRLKPDDWLQYIDQSAKHFSRDRPLEAVIDIAGDGGFEYELLNLPRYSPTFSFIRKVEYPIGKQRPEILDPSDVVVYHEPGTAPTYSPTPKLRFLSRSIKAGDNFRVSYTVQHKLSETESTIEDADLFLIALLAGHYAALGLQAEFARAQEPTLDIDSVDFNSKSQSYAQLADKLLARYADLVSGKTDGAATAVSRTKDYDSSPFYGDRDYLIHGSRER